MSKEFTSRGLRLFIRNFIKQMHEDIKVLTDQKLLVEASILDQDFSILISQKEQEFRAERDAFQFKCFELLQSVELSTNESIEQETKKIIELNVFQDKILRQSESHYAMYKEYHTDYCCLWFGGTNKWACLLPNEKTGGYIDLNFEKCGYKKDDFD